MARVANVCTIVSFVPLEIFEEKPGLIPGKYFIAKSNTKIPSLLTVKNAKHNVYLDETRGSLPVNDPCDEVAKSIVEDFKNSQLGITEVAYPAIFWVPGDLSITEVMEQEKVLVFKMLQAQKIWFLNLCKIADDDWARYHKHNVIADFQREIAHIIGWREEEHEWLGSSIQSMNNLQLCPACTTAVKAEAVVCPACKCILNAEKYKQLTFASV